MTKSTHTPGKPTPADLVAAREKRLRDVIAPGLSVLFCGINPGLYSAAIGCHFGRPGNRFWPVLHAAGFTQRRLHPWEQRTLLAVGLGITNLVARATAVASELTADELRQGARRLRHKVERNAPRWVAVVGLGAYRTAFDRPKTVAGPQVETLAGARLWVLPNPSGLNAHYQLGDLAREFGALREAASCD
jgi:TDG/mug DNA glycosylase family protein